MRLADVRRIETTRDRRHWNRAAEGPLGFEQIVAQFQSAYPDDRRRDWIRGRLEAWRKEAER